MGEENCNPTHTTGTWYRQDRYLALMCHCGSRKSKINIDTPEAYQVFEVQAETEIDGERI